MKTAQCLDTRHLRMAMDHNRLYLVCKKEEGKKQITLSRGFYLNPKASSIISDTFNYMYI